MIHSRENGDGTAARRWSGAGSYAQISANLVNSRGMIAVGILGTNRQRPAAFSYGKAERLKEGSRDSGWRDRVAYELGRVKNRKRAKSWKTT
jgi:hypothetical protein